MTFVVDEGPVGLSAVLFLGALRDAAPRRSARHERRPSARALGRSRRPPPLRRACGSSSCSSGGCRPSRRSPCPSHGPAASASPPRRAALRCRSPRRRSLSSLPTRSSSRASTATAGPTPTGPPPRADRARAPERPGRAPRRLWTYAVDGARVAPRNILLPPSPIDAVPALVAWRSSRPACVGPRRREVAAWTALAALTFAFVSSSAYSQWPHHFFFPPAAAGAGARRSRSTRSAAAAAPPSRSVVALLGDARRRWPGATFPTESSLRRRTSCCATSARRGSTADAPGARELGHLLHRAALRRSRARVRVPASALPDDAARSSPRCARWPRAAAGSCSSIGSRRWERIQTGVVDEVLGPPVRTWRFGDWWAAEYDVARPSRQVRVPPTVISETRTSAARRRRARSGRPSGRCRRPRRAAGRGRCASPS